MRNTAKISAQPRHTALRQNTLMESIYQEVRARLQRGQITPQDRVLDYEIAEEFGCTRMPARQALLRLVNEGYMIGTTRGFVVPVISAADIHEIFEVRRMLEPGAAASAALELTESQLDELGKAYEMACRAYESNDIEAMIAANIGFREVWLSGVRNGRLRATIERFVDHAQQVRLSTLIDPATQKIVVDGLKRLLDAFRSRDAEGVKSILLGFMSSAEERYFAAIRENKAG